MHYMTPLLVALISSISITHCMHQEAIDPRWELAKLKHLQQANSEELQVTGFGESYTNPKTLTNLKEALLGALGSVSVEQPDTTSANTVVKVDINKLLALVGIVEDMRKEAIEKDRGRLNNEMITDFLGAVLQARNEAGQREHDQSLARTTGEYVQSIAADLKEKEKEEGAPCLPLCAATYMIAAGTRDDSVSSRMALYKEERVRSGNYYCPW